MISDLFNSWGKGNCTGWWDSIFGLPIGDICYDHDAAYEAGVAMLKLQGDWRLLANIWQRAGRDSTSVIQEVEVKATSIAMYLAVTTVGWIFWIKANL